MSHGARARQQAACEAVFGCKRGGLVSAAAATASPSIMFSSACCGRFPRRSSTGVRRSAFKLPPAAACSPSQAAVWHVSCILGKAGDGTAAAAAGTGRCIPPSTPNNTTANLYQSQHTHPEIINTETEPKLGCAVAAGAVRCCGVALGFHSVQTFRAGPLAPSTSCNTRISRTHAMRTRKT
jgi:hypothetical protein